MGRHGYSDDCEDEGKRPDCPTRYREQVVAPPPAKAAPAQPQTPATLAGETEYFRSKLAEGRTVRVLFQGPEPTQNEISKLIAMLELTKDQYPIGIPETN